MGLEASTLWGCRRLVYSLRKPGKGIRSGTVGNLDASRPHQIDASGREIYPAIRAVSQGT